VVLLEQNFRSTQTILDAANAVIAKNPSRHAKNLFTDQGLGEKIRLYRAGDEYDEGRWIATELRRINSEMGIAWNQMAVFYRTNAQSRVLEEEMIRARVPYRVISGMRFYDRKEIKTALAYARLIVNPRDEASARRVINEPKRGVGEMAQAKLGIYAAENGLSFAEATSYAAAAGLTAKALAGADRFAFTLEQLRAMANDLSPREMIDAIVRETGMGDALRAENSDEAFSRLENLGELASAAAQYDSLMEFVERMALVAESDHLDGGAGTVSLMTMHVAKGLEFPAVIVTGLEETIFPHKRALADEAELEEERRLCYVGLTRAMKHLVLTHAWSRTMWGSRTDAIPSRFLNEIPPELVDDLSKSVSPRRAIFRDSDEGFEGRQSTFASGRAFGSGSAPPVRSTGAENLNLQVGERVRHDRYGLGTVTKTSGSGTGVRATVDFDDHGPKQLMLAMTPLKRA
jgi:DNA helicase-2/ATP-dependent DNA helicase PcrA